VNLDGAAQDTFEKFCPFSRRFVFGGVAPDKGIVMRKVVQNSFCKSIVPNIYSSE
jgi:hypothetical protein